MFEIKKEERLLAPIVLFVYNRPMHTEQTVLSLQKNLLAADSELFIFSDGYRNEEDMERVLQVREYLRGIKGFKSINIIERKENQGLAKSVIGGATEIINKYGKVIAIEDDLICAPNLLNYMNDGLDYYEDCSEIWAIGGHNHSFSMPDGYNKKYYLAIRTCSWGWATWKSRWDTVDWELKDFNQLKRSRAKQKEFNRGGNDLFGMLKAQMNGEIDSWAVRWDYAASRQNLFTVYPIETAVANIGMDGSGVHCTPSGRYKDIIPARDIEYAFDKNFLIDQEISKHVFNYYKKDFWHEGWALLSSALDLVGARTLKRKVRKVAKKIVSYKSK